MTTRQAEILASLPQSVQFTAGDLQAQLGSVTMRHVRRHLHELMAAGYVLRRQILPEPGQQRIFRYVLTPAGAKARTQIIPVPGGAA